MRAASGGTTPSVIEKTQVDGTGGGDSQHLGAHVREVRDRAHRVREVAVERLHDDRHVERCPTEKRIGLPSEIDGAHALRARCAPRRTP